MGSIWLDESQVLQGYDLHVQVHPVQRGRDYHIEHVLCFLTDLL